MTNAIMTYNQEDGLKAGGGNYISEGGAYVVKILEAKFVKAKTGTSGIEFSLETKEGQKANYITVYYVKPNGEAVQGGKSILNAMMGITGVSGIGTAKAKGQDGSEIYICPELTGKVIGMFLQKTLYTKNAGGDGYKFEIRVPFDANTSKTLREKISGDQPKTIENMTNSYKDKDERTQQATSAPASNGFDVNGFDDDLPDFD